MVNLDKLKYLFRWKKRQWAGDAKEYRMRGRWWELVSFWIPFQVAVEGEPQVYLQFNKTCWSCTDRHKPALKLFEDTSLVHIIAVAIFTPLPWLCKRQSSLFYSHQTAQLANYSTSISMHCCLPPFKSASFGCSVRIYRSYWNWFEMTALNCQSSLQLNVYSTIFGKPVFFSVKSAILTSTKWRTYFFWTTSKQIYVNPFFPPKNVINLPNFSFNLSSNKMYH